MDFISAATLHVRDTKLSDSDVSMTYILLSPYLSSLPSTTMLLSLATFAMNDIPIELFTLQLI